MWQRILGKEWNKKNIDLQTNCQWFLWTVIFSKYVTYGLTIYIDIFLFKILCEEPLIVVTIAAVCDDVMLRSVSLNKVCHVSRNGVTRRVRRQDVATSPSRRRGDTGTGSGTRKAAGIISDWQKLLSPPSVPCLSVMLMLSDVWCWLWKGGQRLPRAFEKALALIHKIF